MQKFKEGDRVAISAPSEGVVTFFNEGTETYDIRFHNDSVVEFVPREFLTKIEPPKPKLEAGQIWRDEEGVYVILNSFDESLHWSQLGDFTMRDVAGFFELHPDAKLVELPSDSASKPTLCSACDNDVCDDLSHVQ